MPHEHRPNLEEGMPRFPRTIGEGAEAVPTTCRLYDVTHDGHHMAEHCLQ